jgi:O-antigen/teichoic acid export membrane protein/O-antigen ligase
VSDSVELAPAKLRPQPLPRLRPLAPTPSRTFVTGLFSSCLILGIGFSLLGNFVGTYMVVGITLAGAVAALASTRPLWAVALVLACAPVANRAIPGVPLGLQVIHIVCVFAIVAVALSYRTSHIARLSRVEIRLPLVFGVLFILAAVLSTGMSGEPTDGVKSAATLIGGLLMTGCIVVVAHNTQRLRILLGAATLGSLSVTLYSLLGGEKLVSLYGGAVVQNREVGTFTDPNTFGSFCMLMMFAALAWLLVAEHLLERLVAVAGVLCAGGGLMVSLSRGAWLGAIVGAVVVIVIDPKARGMVRRFAAVGIAGVLLTLLVLPTTPMFSVVRDRVLSVGSASQNPYDVRPITWREALREFERAPALGNGPGSFSVLSAQSGSELQFYPRRHAHNGLLTIAAEMGLAGVITILGLTGAVALAVRNRARQLRAVKNWKQLGVLAATVAGLAGLLGHLVVDYPLRNPVLMVTVWIMLGFVLAVIATPNVRPSRVPSASDSGTVYRAGEAMTSTDTVNAPEEGPQPLEPDRTQLLPLVAPAAIRPTVSGPEDSDVQLRKLAKSGTLSFVGAILSGVLGFAVVVQVSRGLGPANAGIFALAVAVFMTLSVAGRLGVDTGLVRILPPLQSSGRSARIHATVRAALVPMTVGLTVIAAAMWWLAPLLAPVLLPDVPADEASQLLRIVAALLPLGTASFVALAATRGLGSIKPMVVVENILKPVARCALVGAVLLLGAGVFGATVAWAVGTGIGIAVSAWSLRRALLRSKTAAEGTSHGADAANALTLPGEQTPWRELWAFSAPRGVSSICEIIGLHVGVVLVSALSGPADAGIYNAALRLVLAGTLAMQALRLATAPQVSRLLNNAQAGQVQRLHQASSGWVIVLSWPPYLIMAIWPEHVLSIFGNDFSAGTASLVILALATLVNLFTGNVATLLLMSGGSGATLTVTVASLVVQITLCAVLAPTMGALGGAIAKGVSVFGENIALTLLVRDKLGVRTLCKPTLLASGLAVLCFAVPAGVLRLAGVPATGETGLLIAGFGAAAGLGAYWLGLWRLKSMLQLSALADVVRRRKARVSGG